MVWSTKKLGEIELKKKSRTFSRYPTPKKEKLAESLKRWASETGKSFECEIYFYIRGRIGDISKSREDIVREQKRVEKAKQCIGVALELVGNQGEKSRIKQDIYKRVRIRF